MDIAIFVPSYHATCYMSSLFELFSEDVRKHIMLFSSFKNYNRNIFPIFTQIDNYINRFIEDNKIKNYGLILDINKFDISKNINILLKSSFIYFIGPKNESIELLCQKINGKYYERIVMNLEKNEKKYIVAEISSLERVYQDTMTQKIIDQNIYIFFEKDMNQYRIYKDEFSKFGIDLIMVEATPEIFAHMLSHAGTIYYDKKLFDMYLSNEEKNVISTQEICRQIEEQVENMRPSFVKKKSPMINVVCFRPSYLFADLVGRFERVGCVHSDYPLPEADAYIWMRPQEIWHYEHVLHKQRDEEIKETYSKTLESISVKTSVERIHKRSVAIHHGTCFAPLYQFCPEKLAMALYDLPRVVGVCEFEECYGPSADIANPENFVFFPIGYDNAIFTENYIRPDHERNQILKIGIVGRAYGTINKNQLSRSVLSEPYGYRKGGDLILDIALRLNNCGLAFELHILGANWEPLVELLESYNINVVYYERDKNVTYQQFPKVYHNFDLLLIAARCEGGPVSALEALSLGVPVVSTDVGISPFLEKNIPVKKAIECFSYDRKWDVYDKEKAVKLICNIYENNINYDERVKIRNAVSMYTTHSWVNYIYEEAQKIALI